MTRGRGALRTVVPTLSADERAWRGAGSYARSLTVCCAARVLCDAVRCGAQGAVMGSPQYMAYLAAMRKGDELKFAFAADSERGKRIDATLAAVYEQWLCLSNRVRTSLRPPQLTLAVR